MTPHDWLECLDETVSSIRDALATFDRWEDAGQRSDQYALDLVADQAALKALVATGASVLTEESGYLQGSGKYTVIVDPVDGSTNASRRIPHYCTSLCVLDDDGPLVALVTNLANGERFHAIRNEGAYLDSQLIAPSTCDKLSDAIIGVAGALPATIRPRQYRAFGAAALDICSVAAGRLDAYIDPIAHHGVWDYIAAVLICAEAGVSVGEVANRPLIHADPSLRLGPVAAATMELLAELGVDRPQDR